MAIVNVEADASALATATATRIAHLLREACARYGTARLCMTGGHTPRLTYERLAWVSTQPATAIDWSRVHLFWGDERTVPLDHGDSNFGMADLALILPVAVPSRNLHRMRGELPDVEEAARDYERVLGRFERAGAPRFDVVLLGVGTDGHIASLFPGSPLVNPAEHAASPAALLEAARKDRLAAAVPVPGHATWRITLTPRALLDAAAILVLTAGTAKADAVQHALRSAEDIARWPVQLLRRAGDRVEWWLDRDAAAGLL